LRCSFTFFTASKSLLSFKCSVSSVVYFTMSYRQRIRKMNVLIRVGNDPRTLSSISYLGRRWMGLMR
jgi:hypothetical protein